MGSITLLIIETTHGITASTQETSLLSLFIPLFSGFVGGLVVLYIQTRQRNQKDEKERRRELKGLLRIVDLEMAKNDDLLQAALAVDTLNAAGAQLNPILELRTLQITDWNNTKVILARLADGDRFQNLDTYYRRVRSTATLDPYSNVLRRGAHDRERLEVRRECSNYYRAGNLVCPGDYGRRMKMARRAWRASPGRCG